MLRPTLPRRVLALCITLGLGSAGCAQLGAGLVTAMVELPIRAAFAGVGPSKPGYSGTVPPADFSECELARGRWREAHQDAEDVPPEYQCEPGGDWPGGRPAPAAATPARQAMLPARQDPPPTPQEPAPTSVATPSSPPPAPSTEGLRVYDLRNPGVEIQPPATP